MDSNLGMDWIWGIFGIALGFWIRLYSGRFGDWIGFFLFWIGFWGFFGNWIKLGFCDSIEFFQILELDWIWGIWGFFRLDWIGLDFWDF